MRKPLRAWWLLRNSSLLAKERSNIHGHSANKFDYEEIVECLDVTYEDETLREFDKAIRRRAPKQLTKCICEARVSSASSQINELDDGTLQMLELSPETEDL